MINIKKIISESFNDFLLLEGGNDGHMNHLFDQGQLKFSEIRDILKKIFSGKLGISEKIDGMNLNVTYKDGQLMASRNTSTLKNPLTIKELAKHFEDRDESIKTAYNKTMKDLSNALSKLDQAQLNKFFANGQNFMSIEIVYPQTRNIVDYGNRCMIVLHGINVFNDKFKRVGQDKEAADALFTLLKKNDSLKQETFEITGPIKLKLKNIKDNETALNELLAELDKIVDGLGYKATVADYAQERFKKYIVNMATKAGLDLNRNSDFVIELSDRMSNVSGRNPTKSDIATYAKKEGIDIKSQEYKDFINNMTNKSNSNIANTEVIAPLEDLVVKAGTILMNNIEGYISLDPAGYAKKLAGEIDAVKKEFNDKENGLTPEKAAMFKKNLVKLDKYGKIANPAEGLVFMYKGKPYKLTGNFGAINQILNFFRK